MGESEVMEVKVPPAAVTPVAKKPEVKAAPKKDKKKDRKSAITIEAAPTVTGRLLYMEVGTSGVEFAIKGKKGKAEVFSLNGFAVSTLPAAAAMLAGLVVSKTKLRVEFSMNSESGRTINKIRAHS
jgi:hypothetical protein